MADGSIIQPSNQPTVCQMGFRWPMEITVTAGQHMTVSSYLMNTDSIGVRRRHGERYCNDCVVQRDSWGEGSVMFRAAISYHHRIGGQEYFDLTSCHVSHINKI